MPDAQTVYELRQALKRPGCPVCRILRRSGAKYMEGVFYESVLDPVARHKMVDSLGFCFEHTWLLADLKLSDALGQAIVYQDIVGEILETLAAAGNSGGKQVAGSLAARIGCPACKVEEEVLGRVREGLPTILGQADFAEEYRSSAGVCLPHLRTLLPQLESRQARVLIEPRLEQLKALKAELAEFIRKNDYRFRDEPMGAEGDSHLRTAAFLVGEPRPFKKGDLA